MLNKSISAILRDECPYLYRHQQLHDQPLLLGESLVSLRIHEILQILETLLANLHSCDPSASTGVILGAFVDGGRLLLQELIDFGDLASYRGIDVRSRLDGLNGANRVTGSNFQGDGGKLDVDDVTQGVSGVV